MIKKIQLLGSVLAFSALTTSLQAQAPSLQIIHNSADAAGANVKIWANNSVYASNLAFRNATAASTLTAGTYTIGISAPTATAQSQSLAQFTVSLVNGVNYYAVANGIVSPTGYNPNSTVVPFTLSTYTLSQLIAAPTSTQTQLIVHHGSTDAPTIDVVAPFTGTNPVIPNILVNNASYPVFSNLLSLSTANYKIQVRDQNSENVVAEYSAPLQTLGLGGARLVVVASGFLNPTNNSNGPAFGLYVAASTGGSLIPLPSTTATSTRFQAIHNSADAAASQVDVWFKSAATGTNPILIIDNFAFRTASPFIDVPTAQTVTVYISPANSTNVSTAIANFTYNLVPTTKYQVIASGIVSTTGYSPNSTAAPFNLIVNAAARERALITTNTDVLVFHGATDAPAVNVLAQGNGTVVGNISYGNFDPSGYDALPTNNYTLHVTNTAGTSTVASYLAPLSTLNLNGNAITVLASGFLTPANNSNGAAFGLWASLATGGNLVQLSTLTITAINENSQLHSHVKVFPNPFNNVITVQNASNLALEITISDVNGRIVETRKAESGDLNFDTNILSNGLYFINVRNNNSTINYKLIK